MWEVPVKILMSAPEVDTTQSCEALLQNLNEDYQVRRGQEG